MSAPHSTPIAFVAHRLRSFRYAFAGLGYVLRSQRNAWIHGAITLGVIPLSAWLGLSRSEWALIVLAMGAVWTGEITNTAIEAIVDLASPDPHPLARVAKDCAAAAVLVTSGAAVVIGLLVLGPPLWDRLSL
jgi:diacylglycerol kinase